MLFAHRPDHGQPDPGALSPKEWTTWKARVIRSARAEQAATIREAFIGGTAIMIRAARRWTHGWRRHRCERRAAAELRALSDLELRDIAVSRSEIDARVRPGGQFTGSGKSTTAQINRRTAWQKRSYL